MIVDKTEQDQKVIKGTIELDENDILELLKDIIPKEVNLPMVYFDERNNKVTVTYNQTIIKE